MVDVPEGCVSTLEVLLSATSVFLLKKRKPTSVVTTSGFNRDNSGSRLEGACFIVLRVSCSSSTLQDAISWHFQGSHDAAMYSRSVRKLHQFPDLIPMQYVLEFRTLGYFWFYLVSQVDHAAYAYYQCLSSFRWSLRTMILYCQWSPFGRLSDNLAHTVLHLNIAPRVVYQCCIQRCFDVQGSLLGHEKRNGQTNSVDILIGKSMIHGTIVISFQVWVSGNMARWSLGNYHLYQLCKCWKLRAPHKQHYHQHFTILAALRMTSDAGYMVSGVPLPYLFTNFKTGIIKWQSTTQDTILDGGFHIDKGVLEAHLWGLYVLIFCRMNERFIPLWDFKGGTCHFTNMLFLQWTSVTAMVGFSHGLTLNTVCSTSAPYFLQGCTVLVHICMSVSMKAFSTYLVSTFKIWVTVLASSIISYTDKSGHAAQQFLALDLPWLHPVLRFHYIDVWQYSLFTKLQGIIYAAVSCTSALLLEKVANILYLACISLCWCVLRLRINPQVKRQSQASNLLQSSAPALSTILDMCSNIWKCMLVWCISMVSSVLQIA